MVDRMRCTTLVVKLNLKLQSSGQAYVIILTRTYLFKETITVPNTGTAAAPNSRNKKVIPKNCVPFTDCISDSNNKEIDHAKDIDVAISMYNLIKYSDNYSKTSVRL